MARWGHFRYGQAHYDEPENLFVKIKPTHMRDLHTWPTNPFDDPSISLPNLLAYTSDHLTKMTDKNTGGFLTARITATTTAFAGVNTAAQTDANKGGERKTATGAKTAYRDTITAGADQIYQALIVKYGKKSITLKTFFPEGLTGFNRKRDDEMGNALSSLVTELTNHQADVGAPLVAQATALRDGWNAVYTPSEASSGAKDTSIDTKNTARAALQLELFKNLLTISLQFPRQPEIVDVYMQPSLLSPHNPAPTPTPTPTPTP
jgi:hypothetical protein